MTSKEGTSDAEKQLRFAIDCIKSVDNFRPNIEYLAKAGEVNRGAASKRWERFRKAHGLDAPGREVAPKQDEVKDKKGSGEKAARPSKKRKLSASNIAEENEEVANADGDNGMNGETVVKEESDE